MTEERIYTSEFQTRKACLNTLCLKYEEVIKKQGNVSTTKIRKLKEARDELLPTTQDKYLGKVAELIINAANHAIQYAETKQLVHAKKAAEAQQEANELFEPLKDRIIEEVKNKRRY
ncbi:hypothetical protein [Viridibacillus sp. FSL H8-0123]|uniref:hypothetical protein n=1 Tax=Viridibacillus sp. FSL H8-0123 TaxID=1928922 RepID=UPI00096E7003|nr:hypothetical protein [Viridibacillus sp. FSL H8-0123]OMC80927.1 hypothetical protein BK130_16525 [Viridibacillus sp. FSL H8-0123]